MDLLNIGMPISHWMLLLLVGTPPHTPAPACDADNGGITLPSGFCATVFADNIQGPRHVTVAPNGVVYVTVPGGVMAFRATKDDGHADATEKFGDVGGTGIAIHGEYLYVDVKSAIVRYRLPGNALAPSGPPDTIVRDLPTGGHASRNIAFDRAGLLYVNVGSRTNSCQTNDRQNNSPGVDPCTELDTRAGIWRFQAAKSGQTFASGEHIVTGIRNAMGLALNPNDGQMYATQHGRDQLAQNWSSLYQQADGDENPAEEFVRFSDHDDFGWPYCYYDMRYNKLVLAPEYGGDGGHKIDRCASKRAPLVAFPGHWAPMSLLFYQGNKFPSKYRGGAFIAFHGSWNRAPDPQAGYRVVFVPFAKGNPSGDYETFANGFTGKDQIFVPTDAAHRPCGLAEGPDGALYITDDLHGRIWRVVWKG
jgi:glucose/arabinose dehydrogenase